MVEVKVDAVDQEIKKMNVIDLSLLLKDRKVQEEYDEIFEGRCAFCCIV